MTLVFCFCFSIMISCHNLVKSRCRMLQHLLYTCTHCVAVAEAHPVNAPDLDETLSSHLWPLFSGTRSSHERQGFAVSTNLDYSQPMTLRHPQVSVRSLHSLSFQPLWVLNKANQHPIETSNYWLSTDFCCVLGKGKMGSLSHELDMMLIWVMSSCVVRQVSVSFL